jgi:DNA-binding MarR family transcriptional regulator
MTDERMERAITVFGRASALLDGPRLHVWDERGLSLPQLRILSRVRQTPGLGVKDLALAFGVSASNITQQVDKLVMGGLMARTERQGDRRYVSLTLTADGEQVAGEYSAAARAYLREALGALTPDELEQLTHLLARVVEHAPSGSASPARA